MEAEKTLADKHGWFDEVVFRLKSGGLIARRCVRNTLSPHKRFRDKGQLIHEPVISYSESILWNDADNKENHLLTAGKIENLRIAAHKLNGVEVNKGRVFSFWKHIGNPNFRQGFVIGREIREGCIVPTIAGGLCQISNALYDAALKGGFEILERHRHTKVIRGSLAEQDRDATVKWNYVDLRFRAKSAFRIEVDLTSDKLVVVFRGKKQEGHSGEDPLDAFRLSNTLNDCYSCGNVACFKHPKKIEVKNEKAITTFILDEKYPEYDEYIKTISKEGDLFILPFGKVPFLKISRYSWTVRDDMQLRAVTREALWRAFKLRFLSRSKNNVFEHTLQLDKKLARKASRLIPISCTHLVVAQNLLPFLFDQGALGGRTYDVLMTRLPMEKLHERLDQAHKQHPESATLNDFRAPQKLIDLENKALIRAKRIITPHREIADFFEQKVTRLNWVQPAKSSYVNKGNNILFPSPALARKGAFEMRRLASELGLSLSVGGVKTEYNGFWKDVRIDHIPLRLDNVGLVVHPAYIEHQPRLLLKAVSMGIPVITTMASGLDEGEGVTIVPVGDYPRLKEAVEQWVRKNQE